MVGAAGPGDWATPGDATAQGMAADIVGAIDGEGIAGPGAWTTPRGTAGPRGAIAPAASMLLGASATLGATTILVASAAVGTCAIFGVCVTALAAEVGTADSIVVGLVPAPFAS